MYKNLMTTYREELKDIPVYKSQSVHHQGRRGQEFGQRGS